MRFKFDMNKEPEDLVGDLILCASEVFNERCPDLWQEKMFQLVDGLRKHIADNDPKDPQGGGRLRLVK